MAGRSFSGPAGKVLDHLLMQQGTNREEVLATNVILCQGEPTEHGFLDAVSCCEPRLEAETLLADTVIACGREASEALIGEASIARNRGYPHKRVVSHNGTVKHQRIIVTNNPAMVLRDDGTYPELVRDFRLAINPLPAPRLPEVRFTDDLDEARSWIERIEAELRLLRRGTIVAADIEGGYPNLACVGISIRPERAIVLGYNPCTDEGFVREFLPRILEIPTVSYLWHNGKYDVKQLRRHGINARTDEDSMLLSWCLDERPGDPESGAGGHSLEWLLKDELGWPKYEPSRVREWKKADAAIKREMLEDDSFRRELYRYNGFDTAGCLALFEILKEKAIRDNVWDRPYKSMLIDLSETFTQIEMKGNLFDAERACDILEDSVWPRLREYRIRAAELCGRPGINLNSPQQLVRLLYEEWGITHNLSRPKIERLNKRSTDKAVREELLRGDYTSNGVVGPERIKVFTQTLHDFKELDKQRGTYLEGLVLRVGRNGRIYTDFKIHGTESGRVSSANPNLQNVTRTKDGLPNIRSCFVADPGGIFISADLSQAELRTIANLSGDSALGAIYTDTNRSLHKEVARAFYGENYTYEQYVRAKNINFGVAYWQSAYSFAQMYHMPQEEAQKYIDFWWHRFPKVWEWTKVTEREVMQVGELQSPFGHKRRFYVIPADESGRLHVVKEGINFRPQNIAANITLWALIRFAQKVDWRIAQPRVTVHDSILAWCRYDYAEEISTLLKDCLERAPMQALGWDFPFAADITTGHTWGHLA